MKTARGYGALLSVLVCSALLSLLTAVLSTQVFLGRLQLSHEKTYRAARVAAYTCAQLALHGIRNDPTRFDDSPAKIMLHETETCSILEANSTSATTIGILVQGVSGTSFIKVYVEAVRDSASNSFHIQTWKEY